MFSYPERAALVRVREQEVNCYSSRNRDPSKQKTRTKWLCTYAVFGPISASLLILHISHQCISQIPYPKSQIPNIKYIHGVATYTYHAKKPEHSRSISTSCMHHCGVVLITYFFFFFSWTTLLFSQRLTKRSHGYPFINVPQVISTERGQPLDNLIHESYVRKTLAGGNVMLLGRCWGGSRIESRRVSHVVIRIGVYSKPPDRRRQKIHGGG